MACRQGDRDPAPSMPSVLQLPPVLRELHDEDDVLGSRPGVSIRMWAERVCVCVCCVEAHKCVCERRPTRTRRSEPLFLENTMISIKCRCSARLEWRACFISWTSRSNQLFSFSPRPETKREKDGAGFPPSFVPAAV